MTRHLLFQVLWNFGQFEMFSVLYSDFASCQAFQKALAVKAFEAFSKFQHFPRLFAAPQAFPDYWVDFWKYRRRAC